MRRKELLIIGLITIGLVFTFGACSSSDDNGTDTAGNGTDTAGNGTDTAVSDDTPEAAPDSGDEVGSMSGGLTLERMGVHGSSITSGTYECNEHECTVELKDKSDVVKATLVYSDCSERSCDSDIGCGDKDRCIQGKLTKPDSDKEVIFSLPPPGDLEGDVVHGIRWCRDGTCNKIKIVSTCTPDGGCEWKESVVDGEVQDVDVVKERLKEQVESFPELILPVYVLSKLHKKLGGADAVEDEEIGTTNGGLTNLKDSKQQKNKGSSAIGGPSLGTGGSWISCVKECVEDCGCDQGGKGTCKDWWWSCDGWQGEVCVSICAAGCSLAHPFSLIGCAFIDPGPCTETAPMPDAQTGWAESME